MLFNLLFATVKFRFLLAEDDKFTEQVKFLTSSESEDYVQVLRGVDMLDDDKGLIGMMFPTLVFNLQPFSKRKNLKVLSSSIPFGLCNCFPMLSAIKALTRKFFFFLN